MIATTATVHRSVAVEHDASYAFKHRRAADAPAPQNATIY
jgi:hypothetical protein